MARRHRRRGAPARPSVVIEVLDRGTGARELLDGIAERRDADPQHQPLHRRIGEDRPGGHELRGGKARRDSATREGRDQQHVVAGDVGEPGAFGVQRQRRGREVLVSRQRDEVLPRPDCLDDLDPLIRQRRQRRIGNARVDAKVLARVCGAGCLADDEAVGRFDARIRPSAPCAARSCAACAGRSAAPRATGPPAAPRRETRTTACGA